MIFVVDWRGDTGSRFYHLQHTNPQLLDFIHSGLDQNRFYEHHQWKTFGSTSVSKCAQLCLKQAACDIFYHQGDTNNCFVYPHITLKDKSWSQYLFPIDPMYKNNIYVLQCSTATQNVMSPDPLVLRNVDEWSFHGEKFEAHRYVDIENKIQLLTTSVYELKASETLAISYVVDEDKLPLSIDNEFLTSFPQVCTCTNMYRL